MKSMFIISLILLVSMLVMSLIFLGVSSYCLYQQGKIVVNAERAGIIFLKNGYRAYWIRYSNGRKYPYRIFRDNLWCLPHFEYCDVRPFLKSREQAL